MEISGDVQKLLKKERTKWGKNEKHNIINLKKKPYLDGSNIRQDTTEERASEHEDSSIEII